MEQHASTTTTDLADQTSQISKLITTASTNNPLNKSYNPQSHRRHLVKWLCTIVLSNCALMGALMACFYWFEKIESLSAWEKRIFNILSISITALISICIGWLVNEIGAMIRWPMLSKRAHTLEDVEEILSINSMSSAWTIISRHVSMCKMSSTTTVVTVFLIIAILGRLSVAIFGIAFNIEAQSFHTPSVNATLWPNTLLSDSTASITRPLDENTDMFATLSEAGLNRWGISKFGRKPKTKRQTWAVNKNGFNITTDLRVQNLEISVDGPKASYTYHLRNFGSDGNITASNRTIAAEATCRQLEIRVPGGTNRTAQFFDPDRQNLTTFSVSNSSGLFFIREQLIVDHENVDRCGSRCTTLWILWQDLKWKNSPKMIKCNTSVGVVDFPTPTDVEDFTLFPELNIGEPRAHDLTSFLADGENMVFGSAGSVYYSWRLQDDNGQEMPLNNLFALKEALSGDWDDIYLEQWTAGILARTTATLVQFFDNFGSVKRAEIRKSDQSTRTFLVVQWDKAIAACCILASIQVLMCLAVMAYCWNVIIKDQSNLAMAQALKAITEEYQGGGLADGNELAKSLGHGFKVVYGTTYDASEGLHVLGLRRRGDVESVFPKGLYE